MTDIIVHTDISKNLAQPDDVSSKDQYLLKLIVDCCKDIRLAQSELYKKTFPFLYKIAIRYEKSNDDALEILNEAFFKILINIKKYDIHKSYHAWAKTILLNCIFNKFKSRNRLKSAVNHIISNAEYELVNTAIPPDIFEKIESEHVLKLLDSLPEVTRHIFNLFVMEEYAHKEIAELLNISVNGSKWHVYEGKRKLLENLKLYNYKSENGK